MLWFRGLETLLPRQSVRVFEIALTTSERSDSFSFQTKPATEREYGF